MPKKLAVGVLVVLVALLVGIPVGSAGAGQMVVGTSSCYVVIEYWEVGVTGGHPNPPFVEVWGPYGNIGGGVYCPIPPIIDELID
jgi:hypothetical protein